MKIFRAVFVVLLLGWISFTLVDCEIDHGLQPIHSRIGGVIRFTGTRVPPASDEIRVAVVKDFPPKNIQELLFSDMIPFKQNDSVVIQTPVPWEIYLPPGHYDMAAVIWKENNSSWNISDVVGVYGGLFLGDMLIPTYQSIDIPSSRSVIDTLDIQANLNRVDRDAVISGTVTFQGKWPDNTGIVGVGAFVDIPKKGDLIDYYFKNVALAYDIPPYSEKRGYRLRVRSKDTLKYIAVVWINSYFDLTSLQDIGYYADPVVPSNPGTVSLFPGEIKENVNIVVNFQGN